MHVFDSKTSAASVLGATAERRGEAEKDEGRSMQKENERTRVWESKTGRDDVSVAATSRYCYRRPKLPSVQENTRRQPLNRGAEAKRTAERGAPAIRKFSAGI